MVKTDLKQFEGMYYIGDIVDVDGDGWVDENGHLGIAPPFAIGDLVYRKSDDARFPMKVVKMRKMFASPLHAVTTFIGNRASSDLR